MLSGVEDVLVVSDVIDVVEVARVSVVAVEVVDIHVSIDGSIGPKVDNFQDLNFELTILT